MLSLARSLKSLSIPFIYKASQIPWAIDLNSASTLERATTFNFLLLYVTKLPIIKVQYPEVNILSTTELA